MKRTAIVLVLALAAAALAQPAGPDTTPAASGALRALETQSRSHGRSITFFTIALIVGSALAVWQLFTLGRRVAEAEELRVATERRLAELADEQLRFKRRQTDAIDRLEKLDADLGVVAPGAAGASQLPAQLDSLAARIAEIETRLQTVLDHLSRPPETAAPSPELLAAVRAAEEARSVAEGAAVRAESALATLEEAVNRIPAPVAGPEPIPAAATVETEEPSPEPAETEPDTRPAARADRPASRQLEIGPAEPDPKPAGPDPADGRQSFREGDYETAVERLDAWIEANEPTAGPDDLFAALHDRAAANLRLGRFGVAIADATRLGRIDGVGPKAAGASHLLIGTARLYQGQLDPALAELNRALAADPHVAEFIAADEDIRAWLAANPVKGRKVKRLLDRAAGQPDAETPAAEEPAVAAPVKKPAPRPQPAKAMPAKKQTRPAPKPKRSPKRR